MSDNSKSFVFEQRTSNLSGNILNFVGNAGAFFFNSLNVSLKFGTSLAYFVTAVDSDASEKTKNYEHAKHNCKLACDALYKVVSNVLSAFLDVVYIANDCVTIGYNFLPENSFISSGDSHNNNNYIEGSGEVADPNLALLW